LENSRTTALWTGDGDFSVPVIPSEAKELPENPLTRREQEILAMIVAGRSNQEIADLLYIAPGTVRVHYTEKSGLFSQIHSLLNSLSASFNKLELSPYFT